MTRTVTAVEAIAALEAVVAAAGEDFVYPDEDKNEFGTCQYLKADGTPSCIAGHVVALLEPEATPLLKHMEGKAATSLNFPGRLYFDPFAAHVLDIAQQEQDQGKTWGEALAHVRLVYSRRIS